MVKATASTGKTEGERSSGSSGSPTGESCKYKGVRKRKWGKWVSEIRLPNSRERIWLGSYDSPEKAARAFDAALFCLRGRSAKFNFPENPPEIAGGRSLSPPEIQLAAARFANSGSHPTPAGAASENLQAESPCGSSVVSDGTVQLEGSWSELMLDEPFMDLLTNMDSGNFAADYGIFPGFDELNNGFIAPPPPDQVPGGVDYYYGDENLEGMLAQDPLWNF